MTDNDTTDTQPNRPQHLNQNTNAHSNTNKAISSIRKVIDACGLHKAQHDSGKISSSGGEKPSEKCQQNLQSLSNVLPKIEATFFEDYSLISESDVKELCYLYSWILENGFCPHAALLIFENRMTNLGRIAWLLRLFVSSTSKIPWTVETCDVIARIIAQLVLLVEDENLRQSYMRGFVDCLQQVVCVQRVICCLNSDTDNDADTDLLNDLTETIAWTVLEEVRQVVMSHHNHNQQEMDDSNRVITDNAIIIEFTFASGRQMIGALSYTLTSVMTNVVRSNRLWLANRQTIFRSESNGNSCASTLNRLIAAIRAILLQKLQPNKYNQALFVFAEKKIACSLLESILEIIESECPHMISMIALIMVQFMKKLLIIDSNECVDLELDKQVLRMLQRTALRSHIDNGLYDNKIMAILFEAVPLFDKIVAGKDSNKKVNDNLAIMNFHMISEYLQNTQKYRIAANAIDVQAYTPCIISLMLQNIQHSLPVHSLISILIQLNVSHDDDMFDYACKVVLTEFVVGSSSGFLINKDRDFSTNSELVCKSTTEEYERSERRKRRRITTELGSDIHNLGRSPRGNNKASLNLHKVPLEENEDLQSIKQTFRGNIHTVTILINALSKSAAFANQIVNSSDNACILSLVNSSSCYSLSASLRLLLKYYYRKTTDRSNNVSLDHIRRTIQHFCHAMSIIARAIARACCDELPTSIGPKRIKKILASLVGASFTVYDCKLNEITGDMSDEVVKCALTAWSSNSILLHQYNPPGANGIASLDSLSSGISNLTSKYFCQRCHALSIFFGVQFDALYTCNETGGLGQCAECTLPLNARCIFLAGLVSPEKLYSFVSMYKNHKEYPPTFIFASVLATLPLLMNGNMSDHLLKSLLFHSISYEDVVIQKIGYMIASALVVLFTNDKSKSYLAYILTREPNSSILEHGEKPKSTSFMRDLIRGTLEKSTFVDVEESPHVRLAKWYFIVDVISHIDMNTLLSILPNRSNHENPVLWAFRVPFTDKDYDLRRITSKHFGKILLSNNGLLLKYLFFDRNLEEVPKNLDKLRLDFDQALCKAINEIKVSLHTSLQSNSAKRFVTIAEGTSTLRCFSSICISANLNHLHENVSYSYALTQLFCCWARKESSVLNLGNGIHRQLSDLAYSEIFRIHGNRPLHIEVPKSKELLCTLFSDMYFRAPLDASNDISIEMQIDQEFEFLFECVRTFLVPPSGNRCYDEVFKFLDSNLPHLLTNFILNEEISLLLGCCSGFRMFLRQKGSEEYSKVSSSSKSILQRKRQEELCIICLDNMHEILPQLLLVGGKSCLVFLLTSVLAGQEKISLTKLVQHRELSVLKALVTRAAMDVDEILNDQNYSLATSRLSQNSNILMHLSSRNGINALHKASLLRFHESFTSRSSLKSKGKGLPPGFNIEDIESMEATASDRVGFEVITKWIGRNFMFLLVNNVLDRLTVSGKNDENSKVLAMKCLFVLLHFVEATAAPQYIPQVMSAVNAAIGDDRVGIFDDAVVIVKKRSRLLAIRALSKFVYILLSHKVSTVGSNLSTIVVSLFPVIIEGSCQTTCSLEKATMKEAVSLLENLVMDDDVSPDLVPYFKFIPFLPDNEALLNTKSELRKHGIEFDTSNEEYIQSRRSPLERSAFKQRIQTLCKMMKHESAGVRRAVLSHVTDMLRFHRSSFRYFLEIEQASTMQFLTVVNAEHSHGQNEATSSSDIASSLISTLMHSLLARCVHETDLISRQKVSICLGELGAVDPLFLGVDVSSKLSDRANATEGDISVNESYHSWRLNQPPWTSFEYKYELVLISNQLVVALKAAPTTQDQHKVAFAIQELICSLEKHGSSLITAIDNDDKIVQNFSKKKQMSDWLKGLLRNEGVLEVIEPFAHTNYKQQNSIPSKKPPFYTQTASYHGWLSSWCRYMIECSNANDKSPWSGLFHSCRAAIRSPGAVSIAEFLLPLLVLDGLCFGNEDDKITITQEMCDVFAQSRAQTRGSFLDEKTPTLSTILDNDERQKVVNTAFTVIETLEIWAERHEKSQSQLKSSNKKRSHRGTIERSSNWPLEESLLAIRKLTKAIPFIMRSTAAAEIGMHARSLRYLELDSRERIANPIFNNDECHNRLQDIKGLGGTIAPLDSSHLSFVQQLLGHLNDFDSLSAVAREGKRSGNYDLVNEAHERVVQGDWSGALQKYEQCLQLRSLEDKEMRSFEAERGVLKSLLELGQLESVINQVRGILSRYETDSVSPNQLMPFAAEASWRLGRWSLLDDLVASKTPNAFTDEDDRYQMALSEAMLGLHQRSENKVNIALKEARSAAMTSLSSVARDSYVRSYPHILRLHALREIEQTIPMLCIRKSSDLNEKYTTKEGAINVENSVCKVIPDYFSPTKGWKERLDLASPEVIGSSTILNVRLGLSRFAKAPGIECDVWLTIGKRARKQGLFHIAEIALTHADAITRVIPVGINNLHHQIQFQLSKVKYACGESSSALMMLEQDETVVNQLLSLDETQLDQRLLEYSKENSIIDGCSGEVFVKRLLKSTEWIIGSGLKSGPEVMNRFKLILGLRPLWEKSHFSFARYLDSVLETKVSSLVGNNQQEKGVDDDLLRQWALAIDPKCRGYLLDAMRSYLNALCYGDKHLLQAMPRLLSIWFDLTSVDGSSIESPDELELLVESQIKANKLMRDYRNRVPSFSFYSALPQLISRVGHKNEDTSLLVKKILGRVLSKFPEQAMWPLAWLINSSKADRASVGMDIFDVAQKYHAQQENMKFHDLLVESKSLFKFLIDLAKYKPKNASTKTFKIKPWKGTVQLMDFVPPVQAALSGVFRGNSRRVDHSKSNRHERDYFSSFVPRMRSFASDIQMMSSKARPKKITAFAVTTGSPVVSSSPGKRSDRKLQAGDVGEMHFLVKQEAKGDLRKDARVQDLNNVINRLLSGSTSGSHGRQRRILHLRTFSVVCLSEECGILEWVPNTDSFRNIISKSYNPQSDPDSIRRHGKRITNFGDVNLRNTFQKCQDLYIKGGNLTGAAKMFEEQMLRDFPPLLYWWFVQHFEEPHAWFEARTKFALSSAIWSAVGHVIGLGDRHSENLLLDISSGDCVHVDFDCIFDKGLHLPRPEVIPFRLTPNMIDAFGPTGYEGTYRGGLSSAMTTLREHKDTLLSVLEPFLKDPVIDWKRQRSQQRDSSRSRGSLISDESTEAKRSIKVIDGRLRGIYNLSNPNFKKIKRTDRPLHETEDEMSYFVPLCVEGQVQKMISEATSHENLVQLYVGWMPWI